MPGCDGANALCVSSAGRVEYTKGGVPGGARCLVVGLAEGDGWWQEVKRERVV